MVSKFGKGLLNFWLILTLGSVNIVGFSLAGLMLLLAWLKVDRVLWGLLWIPVYAIVLTMGYRRYRQFKARQEIHRIAVARDAYEKRNRGIDERTRLDQIREVLSDPSVQKAIKEDLNNLRKIRDKEEWRLGVILPGHDLVGRLGFLNPSKRAVIFPKSMIGHLADIAVSGSTSFYSRHIRLAEGHGEERYLLQKIKVLDPYHGYQPIPLPLFLQEEGFPIEQSKLSRQLMTIASGVIVRTPDPEGCKPLRFNKVFHPQFFIQRVLIDDEGEVIWLGLDYGQDPTPKFSVWMHPTLDVLTKLLMKLYQELKGAPWHYEPLVWYHTSPLPFTVAGFPLLDIPLPGYTLVEVIIEPDGIRDRDLDNPDRKEKVLIHQSQILIPRKGADFEAMIKRLEEHWGKTLSDCRGHLLHLTKDKDKLREYLDRKMEIINEYYLVEDYKLKFKEDDKKAQKQRRDTPPSLQAGSLLQRAKERAERLSELHPKHPGMRRAVRRGGLIGGLLCLPLALYWGKGLLAVIFLVVLGVFIGEMFVRTYRMGIRRFHDGLAMSQRWAFLLGFIIGGLDYLIFRDLSRIWVSGLIGFLWGHHRGFIRWYNQEARILNHQLFKEMPIEDFPPYSDHRYGFSMRYPPGWIGIQGFEKPFGKKVEFFSPDRGVYINVVVGHREGPDPTTPEEYEQEIDRLLRAVLGPKDFLISKRRIQLQGIEPRSGVWEVVYVKTSTLLRRHRKIKKIAFVRQGVEYFIAYGAPPNKFDWYEETFDRCVQSLELQGR